jgi:CRISPR type III-A-associated protein Csm2
MTRNRTGNKGEKKEKHETIKYLLNELKNNKDKKLIHILSKEDILRPNGMADRIANELKKELKTSQLRKIFEKVKEIEDDLRKNRDYKGKILELYPKLAYSTGRKLMPRDFYNLLISLLERAERDREDAELLVKFITAIVAYSKLYE